MKHKSWCFAGGALLWVCTAFASSIPSWRPIVYSYTEEEREIAKKTYLSRTTLPQMWQAYDAPLYFGPELEQTPLTTLSAQRNDRIYKTIEALSPFQVRLRSRFIGDPSPRLQGVIEEHWPRLQRDQERTRLIQDLIKAYTRKNQQQRATSFEDILEPTTEASDLQSIEPTVESQQPAAGTINYGY